MATKKNVPTIVKGKPQRIPKVRLKRPAAPKAKSASVRVQAATANESLAPEATKGKVKPQRIPKAPIKPKAPLKPKAEPKAKVTPIKVQDNPETEPLTPQDVRIFQAPLIDRINQRMIQDEMNQGALAKHLNVTPSYITSIFSGLRWVPKSDRRVINSIAQYLEVPVVQIFIWAGFFGPADLIVENNLSTRLDIYFKTISKDPLVRHISPPLAEWKGWEDKTKLRYVMLYEFAASRTLLEHSKMEYKDSDLENLEWILKKKNPSSK